MMRSWWGLLLLTVAPCAALADDSAPVPWGNKFFAPVDAPPVIVHDFGNVPWGTTLTHRFVMTNIYKVPMQIVEDPKVSCGCTRIVRYTQKLESRETGFIDIEMDGRRFQGPKAVTITIQFGPKYRSTAVLQVRAFGRTDVAVNPGQVNFGVVSLGQQPAQAIDVQYSGQQQNWQITDVDSTNAPSVKVELKRLPPSRGTVGYRLTTSLKNDASTGILQEQVVLKTNDPNGPVVIIPVAGAVQAPLAIVQGSRVKLDPVPVGKESVRNIMVRGNKPFKIVKIDGEGNGLSVKYYPISNPIQNVMVSFKPTQPGELQRKLTIYTDQRESASVVIEATAEEASPP